MNSNLEEILKNRNERKKVLQTIIIEFGSEEYNDVVAEIEDINYGDAHQTCYF